jgi:hypothetical protein
VQLLVERLSTLSPKAQEIVTLQAWAMRERELLQEALSRQQPATQEVCFDDSDPLCSLF